MKKGDHKLFESKPALYRVINLRLNGYALTSLAILFKCHRSSIEHQMKKYGIENPETPYNIEGIISRTLFYFVPAEPKWKTQDGERISQGKSYKDYLKESQVHRPHIRIL